MSLYIGAKFCRSVAIGGDWWRVHVRKLARSPHSEVKGLRARWNRRSGIRVGSYAIVSDSTAYANGENGIYAASGAAINGNTLSENGEGGIYASSGATISANSALSNGVKDIYFKNYGIKCSAGSNVQNNSVRSNTGYGLFTDPGCGYRGNVITNNTDGTVSGSGVNLGGNLCETNTVCP